MAAQGVQPAKLVLLGDMGAGKSSLVLRFVKGQFTDYQVSPPFPSRAPSAHAPSAHGRATRLLARPARGREED